jgi:hypothetical protein
MTRIRLAMGLPALALAVNMVAPTAAHPPDWNRHGVTRRIDVIPPLGNNLPRSYAARYNRPAYMTGLIMHWIEPSSQEAMAWHRAVHRGYYRNHAPRMETHYCYPKPWEALAIGGRTQRTAEGMQLPVEEVPAQQIPGYWEGAAESAVEPPYEIHVAPPAEVLPVPKLEFPSMIEQ